MEITITWSTEDVLDVRPYLTEQEANEVLMCLKDNHDVNIGINWDIIKFCADELYPESIERESK